MEVVGKTIKEVIEKFLQEINRAVECEGNSEDFSTRFEIKGISMQDVLEKFANKIVNYFDKKRALFESIETEIIPGKKWVIKCSLKGKIFERMVKDFKRIEVVALKEEYDGWKLLFSMKQ